MSEKILGIHHVTAIAGEAQRNLDFYVGQLGLRLVKRTVNFDDPGTYHFYYGDPAGRPGTILTHSPRGRGVVRGRPGTGQVTETAFSVPVGSEGYWADRLRAAGVEVEESERLGDPVLSFADPDGLRLEIVPSDERDGAGATEHGIHGFHGATLSLASLDRTVELLTGLMGFRIVGEKGDRVRLEVGEEGFASRLDLVVQAGGRFGQVGMGSVHHIAFRVRDDEAQRAWRRILEERGHGVSPVMDRQYFRSIYFREPGGVLFEIATDPPGFATDESPEELGAHLKLPSWLEQHRPEIEARLPEIEVPVGARR